MNTRKNGLQNDMRLGLVIVATLSVAMLAGAGAVHADTIEDGAPHKAVSYQDLDLNSAAGVRVLYRRIQGAADQVCGRFDGRDLQAVTARQACVERAVSDAVAAVNSPKLTQVSEREPSSQAVVIAQVR